MKDVGVQVSAKAAALVQFLQGLGQTPRTYALLQLAGRLVSQCECQVALSHAFAFPLAEVTAAVAAAHPDLVPLLLSKLQHVRGIPSLSVTVKGANARHSLPIKPCEKV